MDVAAFLAQVQEMPWYQDQIAHAEDIPSRTATYGALDGPIDPALERSLETLGISSPYSHQAQAINALSRGRHVAISTPAASGKSLCYNLPVLTSLLADRSARALYLFPTKALAQDQLRKLEELAPADSRLRFGLFDGDTPTRDRPQIRRSSQILITNPDMLHLGVLPNHRSWHRLLSSLAYVVLDEAHVYRGVFGSHVAYVIRRLRRLCRKFGSDPQFILSSATIANPGEHAERLVGLPFQVVTEDGAPYGGKDFVFWNPPLVDMAEGSRRSSNSESALLMSELVRRRVRFMTFVRSRRMAELLFVNVRNRLVEAGSRLADRIAPYRASYLPSDRRRIESDLFEGRLLGLITTTAMELGVDIGDLEATILTGYPGTIASTWQQAGRSGRRGQRALTVLVALADPLNQYLMNHPDSFFGKSAESARISMANEYILKPQLLCAAYEMPLTAGDSDLFDTDISAGARELVDDGLLHARGSRWHLEPNVSYPAQDVNIRSATSDFFTLVERDTGAVLETVGEGSAFLQLHPGAVYLHQGEPYLVTDLDLESQTAYMEKTDVPYYTQVRDFTETRILREFKSKAAARTTVHLGEVEVTTRVSGFIRRANFTDEYLGEEYVDIPPRSYETVALWFDVPKDTLDHIRDQKMHLAGGLHATEHAAIGVLPLFAMCDRNDIGGITTPLHPDTGRPQVFIHDGHPGGVGIAEHGYEKIEELWQVTLDVISACQCESGCPSCIQSPKCGSNNEPLDKAVAELVLRGILGQFGAGADLVEGD